MVTLSQIEQRIVLLQKKADELRRKKSASVVSSIRKMMAEHGLSIKDIETGVQDSDAPRKRGRPVGSKNGVRTSVAKPSAVKPAPKYRDPATGATWSGRARPPAWIKDAKDRSVFLIEQPGVKAVSTQGRRKRA
jgi:DNA-binding protein H-NS